MTAMLDTEVRACEFTGCRQPLVRRGNEGSTNWRQRRFCSPACANRSGIRGGGRKPIEVSRRVCARPGCGSRLHRRRGENSRDWSSRRFCSSQCHRQRATPITGRPAERTSVALVVPTPERWERNRAACGGNRDSWWASNSSTEEEERLRVLAVQFCLGCPSRSACLRKGREVQEGLFSGVLWRTDRGDTVSINLLARPAEAVAS